MAGLIVTAVIFGILFKKGVNTGDGELPAAKEHGHSHASEEGTVADALKHLAPDVDFSSLEKDPGQLKDPEVASGYMKQSAGHNGVYNYFSALAAIGYGDSVRLHTSYQKILMGEADEQDQMDLIVLLEDINLRGIEAGVDENWCRINLADLYKNSNPPMKAVQQLLAVVANDSNHVEATYRLAVLAVQSGQLEKARERFKKLVSLQPQNQDFRKHLLAICKELNDSECVTAYSE